MFVYAPFIYLSIYLFLYFVFLRKISLCNSFDCLWTYFIDQTGFKLIEIFLPFYLKGVCYYYQATCVSFIVGCTCNGSILLSFSVDVVYNYLSKMLKVILFLLENHNKMSWLVWDMKGNRQETGTSVGLSMSLGPLRSKPNQVLCGSGHTWAWNS